MAGGLLVATTTTFPGMRPLFSSDLRGSRKQVFRHEVLVVDLVVSCAHVALWFKRWRGWRVAVVDLLGLDERACSVVRDMARVRVEVAVAIF